MVLKALCIVLCKPSDKVNLSPSSADATNKRLRVENKYLLTAYLINIKHRQRHLKRRAHDSRANPVAVSPLK